MICQKCGITLADGAKFCVQCGANTEKVTMKQPQIQQFAPVYMQLETPETVKAFQSIFKKKSWVVILIGVLGLLSTVIIFFTGCSMIKLESQSGTSLAESYYQAVGYATIGLSFAVGAITLYFTTKLAMKDNK